MTIDVRPKGLLSALAGTSPANLATDDLDQIRAAGAHLGSFDSGDITIGHFQGETPWERHVDGDELLLALEGAVVVTILTDIDSTTVDLAEGSICVVPKGHWHRTAAREPVKLFTLRATDHGPVSFAEDPRKG